MSSLVKEIVKLGTESKGMGCAVLILLLVLAAGLIALECAIGTWLWGLIAVKIFGAPALSFWQFAGLAWLLHILFPGSAASVSSNSKD